MSEKTFHVEIVTPRGQTFSGEATMVALPGVAGPFQVLYNHAPIVAQIGVGLIRIVDAEEKEKRFATSGGFIEMNHNRMTVIAETVEATAEIDVARAEAAMTRAQQRIEQSRLDRTLHVDVIRAEAALARASNRLRLARM